MEAVRFTTTCVSVAVALLAGCSPGPASSPPGAPIEAAPVHPLPIPISAGPVREPPAPAPAEAGAPSLLDRLLSPPGLAARPLPELVDSRPRPLRQWDHVAQAGGGTCREQLAASGAKFQPIPDRQVPDAKGCGIPHGVLLSRGPSGIRYSPPVSLDCGLALKLVEVERVVQEEAELHLGAPVTRVGTLGSFACRKVIGRLAGWSDGISEHSFGNAIDVTRFETAKGAVASVLRGYERGVAEPATAHGRFLRAIAGRLRHEAGVRVLGPDFDASHRDHFHLDAGLPRWR